MNPHDLQGEGRERASACLAGSNHAERIDALGGLAIFDDDQAFVEAVCLRLISDAAEPLRPWALMCLGHLVRRFRTISPEARALVEQCAQESGEAGACAGQTLDDIKMLDDV